ncbi:MAG: CBS domain-containing protein [Rhodocyclaceae bacterium]|nr:CBS domain-containing protein [Rhodocyclaceae bacterium]
MKSPNDENAAAGSGEQDPPELELCDEDILDAMRHIPGYLDISTEDFRAVYHLAHRHAVERLFGRIRARGLMHAGIPSLAPDMMLDEAARALVRSGYKSLPVVDGQGNVVGMLTETDFLRRLQADQFLELLLRLIDDSCEVTHRCHETPVSAAMTAPAISVGIDAGFREIMAAFRRHPGRSVPVLDEHGRVCGLLLRKDFLAAFSLAELP